MKRAALLPLVVLSLSSTAAPPAGSTWKDAKITDMMTYTAGGPGGKGYVVVTFSANGAGNPPSCASGYPRSVAIDLSTAGGAFAASQLKMALMAGQPITVTGTGSCSVIPTTETVASLEETAAMNR